MENAVKFKPVIAHDEILKNSTLQHVTTRHQCISAMREYEHKSLEVIYFNFLIYTQKNFAGIEN